MCMIVRKISFPFANLSDTPTVSRDEESNVLYTKVKSNGKKLTGIMGILETGM